MDMQGEAVNSIDHVTSSFSASSPPSEKRYSRLSTDIAKANRTLSSFGRITDEQTALESIVDAIQLSGLPVTQTMVGDSKYLGRGSQFVVHKECIVVAKHAVCRHQYVAVKRAQFDLDPDKRIDLADPKWSRNLHDIYLEVIALTMPALRDHPNIVRLVGISIDSTSFHFQHVPILIMELAYSTLARLLSDDSQQWSFDQKHLLCHDIGAGLDVLHKHGLLHGDVKSDNVLIFVEGDRYVAKLADFGLSVLEADMQKAASPGGTPGWMAPEVQLGHTLKTESLLSTDTYSFGLLVWSIVFHLGAKPPLLPVEEIIETVRLDFRQCPPDAHLSTFNALGDTVQLLLSKDPSKRPRFVSNLLGDKPDVKISFSSAILDYQASINKTPQRQVEHATFKYFDWEMVPLDTHFRGALYDRYVRDKEALTGDMIFLLFLAFTNPPARHLQPPGSGAFTTVDSSTLELLQRAAAAGSDAAQSVLLPAYRYFDTPLPAAVADCSRLWLSSLLAEGALNIKAEMYKIESIDEKEIQNDFRLRGGYNRFYDRLIRNRLTCGSDYSPESREKSYTPLHRAASYGTWEDLRFHSRTIALEGPDIMTDIGESPLYLACVRGAWLWISELLRLGASASGTCTPLGVTCLHWLFAIEEDFQAEAAAALTSRGADVNGTATEIVPFPHYPFSLPAGSPLHWAVVLGCKSAMKALIEQGAEVLLRDRSDPYRYDFRVRMLNVVGGPQDHPFSVSNLPTLGLSPLDYAAMLHDPSILELLLSMNINVDVNSVDEEGFALLHRLSALAIYSTRLGVDFNIRMFQGASCERRAALKRTIRAIVTLGGQLELLTIGSQLKARPSQLYHDYPRYTPLMLAIKNGSVDVARALLDEGASVRTRNEQGETAMHLPPLNSQLAYDSVKLLCEHGADVNATDQHGQTAIINVAAIKSLLAVEYLFSVGIDIASRFRDPEDFATGHSVLSWIASGSYFNAEKQAKENDVLARMLQRYIFSCPDESKRWRVINIAREGRLTLMHRFAQGGLLQCVEALLSHGVAADGLSKVLEGWTDEDGRHHPDTFETPSQGALKGKKMHVKSQDIDRTWSASQFEEICRNFDTIVDLLQSSPNRAVKCGSCQQYSECPDCFQLQWSSYEMA